MNSDLMFSSGKDDWETPQDFFDKLNAEFCFTLDPAANNQNHKCSRYYTERENGLLQNWGGRNSVLQSSIFQSATEFMGTKGGEGKQKAWNHRCYAASGAHGYTALSRLHIRPGGNSIHSRPVEICRSRELCSISVYGCYFQKLW